MKNLLAILKAAWNYFLPSLRQGRSLNCCTNFSIRGYTLTELSISTSVIAMLAVGGLAVMQKKNDTSMAKDTVTKLEKIDTALKGFINAKGYIPCPAVPSTLESSTSFGNSSGIYNTTTKICATGLTNETGMVPVRTLGLSDDMAYDGWGRKFTYRSASASGAAADFGSLNFKGNIAIIDLKGVHKTSINEPPPNNDGAIYVIISHGANGKNVAWRKNVNTTPPGDGSCSAPSGQACGPEGKNTNHARAMYIQNDKTSIFDDVVLYGTKAKLGRQVVMESPIRIEEQICDSAQSLTKDGRSTLDNYAAQNGAYVGRADTIYKSATILSNLCKNRRKAETVSPSRITGLKLWLDAADRATLFTNSNCTSGANPVNSNSIGCWKDKSGTGLDVTSAGTAPTYATSAQNGKPVVVFGKNGYLQRGSVTGGALGSAGEISIFIAQRTNSPMHQSSSLSWEQSGNSNSRINIHALYDDGFHFQYGTNVYNGISNWSAGAALRDVWMLISAIKRTNNSMEAYINGSLYASTASATVSLSTGSTGSLRIGSTHGNNYFDGRIAEVVVYNKALTDLEQRKIEEYLSDKWGIMLSTSTSTCGNGMVFQKTAANPAGGCICPAGTAFVSNLTTANACYATSTSTLYGKCVAVTPAPNYSNPPSKNNMVLWLDANDCTTIGLIGGSSASKVNSWADKSGQGNNATQSTASYQPLYSTNVVNSKPSIKFDGVDDRMLTTLTLNSASTISVVFNYTSTTSAARRAVQGSSNWLIGPYSNAVSNYMNGWVSQSQAVTQNLFYIATATNDLTTGKFYVNGIDRTTANYVGTPGTIGLGAEGQYAEPLDGYISEVLAYNNVLSNQQRDAMESYLANKWAIIRIPSDTTISSNLKVWLDASDKATVFTDSACTAAAGMNDKVGCWKDKSTNNYNATQASDRNKPTYALGLLNNKPALLFDGTNDSLNLGNLSTAFPSAATLFIATNIYSKVSMSGYYSIFNTSTVDSWWRFGDGHGYFGMFRSARIEQYPNTMPTSGSHIISVISSATNYEAFTDGTTNGANGGAYSAGTSYIIGGPDGSSINTTKYFGGPIAEMIIYNTALSTSQRQYIERYLGAKWGITVN